MQTVTKRSSASFLFLSYLCAVLIGILAMVLAKAYQAGFSGADEPAHFLNGYFIANYVSHHLGSNPLGAATDFYIHYPKISIGHWPPAYYGFLGILFLILPPTIPVAFAINVVVAALPAIGVAAALSLLANRRAALAGVLIYALAPLALEGQAMFMVDQPLAACLVAATALWIAYMRSGGWGKVLGFALLAAIAVLIKGNGWLVGLIPVFHIALTGQWRQLLSLKLYVAAAIAAVIVVPWYMLTAKIAADGFNYHAGVDYALKALSANLLTVVQNLTPAGALLALVGVVAEFRARKRSPERWLIVSGIVSLVLATLTLQSLIPVDIVDRYMAPALPALVVLAMLGLQRLLERIGAAPLPRLQAIAAIALLVLMASPGFLHLAERTPKADTGIDTVAQQLAAGGPPSVSVIDGDTSAEGAFIADMAVRDSGLKSYVVRASKLMADSNFMGSSYALRFHDDTQVLAELRRLGVQHVVLVRSANHGAFPHSDQIRNALLRSGSGFHLREQLPHRYRPGTTEVYDATAPVAPNIAALRDLGLPAKASAIVKLQ
jgi:4-amino-4-deoxy-L-arabinose transferase-like glycosyltransferase